MLRCRTVGDMPAGSGVLSRVLFGSLEVEAGTGDFE
jgi:hypothetical protein